jgi:hypothetical protein
MHLHRHRLKGLGPVEITTLGFANVRREIMAARSAGQPWEVRFEWTCRLPLVHPLLTQDDFRRVLRALRNL